MLFNMTQEDRKVWQQLSVKTVRLQILKDFCFPDFVKKFQRMFHIRPKHQQGRKYSLNMMTRPGDESNCTSGKESGKFSKYPFVTLQNQDYQQFLINFLSALEPRHFVKHGEIFNELDAPSECYFIMSGKYDVGYTINDQRVYRLQFGERTNIGGFNLALKRRVQFNYRARTEVNAFAIRRQSWFLLHQEYDHFVESINYYFVTAYCSFTFGPIVKLKKQEIEMSRTNSQFRQVKVVQDMSFRESYELRMHLLIKLQASNNCMLEEFIESRKVFYRIVDLERRVESFLKK